MAGSNPYDATPQVTNSTAAKFIPDIWSDEVIAEYEKNLVLAPNVRKMSMKGKKGDTIHVPKPTRGEASAKVAETSVSLIADTETELVINIDQHWEYSRMIEDITEVQALASLRRFYTSDAGYSLARRTDSILFSNGTGLGNGAGGAAGTPANWVHSNTIMPTATTGAGQAYAEDTDFATLIFRDQTMRDALQILDDADVPMMGRFFVIPPSLCNTIRGIDRYNSADFVTNKGTVNGKIGELYGVEVYVSTNVPVIETAAQNVNFAGDIRGALLAHKDAYVLAEQVGIRSQTQYKQEFLSTLYTADRLFGTKVYRPENGVTIAVAN